MKKLLPILVAICCIYAFYMKSSYYHSEEASVILIQPTVSDVRDTTLLQGTVVDSSPIRLYASGSAEILKVSVTAGQRVAKGQALLHLRSTTAVDKQAETAAVLSQLQLSLESGALEEVEAVLKNLQLTQNDTSTQETYTLYSPVDGFVMDVRVSPGDVISELLPCIVLCDPSNLLIEAYSEEDTIGKLQEKMICEITIPAFESVKGKGSVRSIMPYAKKTLSIMGESTVKTTLQLQPEGEWAQALYPGYRAEVRITTAYRENAILIPYEAVQQDEDGCEYVLKLVNNITVKQCVITGAELAEKTEILEGIDANDILLLEADALVEGVYVKYETT